MSGPAGGPDWLHAGPAYLRSDRETTVPLTVHAGQDHPTAILAARLAPALVALYRHWDDLPSLSPDQIAYALADLRGLGGITRSLEERLIVLARDNGASWRELGAMLDTHWTSARDRYHRIVAAGERGRTADAEMDDAITGLVRAVDRSDDSEADS